MLTVLVHNKCPDFELESPVYFGHNVIWFRSPDQKVDTNTVTRASFGRYILETKLVNALIYKLQMKKRCESSDQSNVDNMPTEDTSTSLQLLVIWKSNDMDKYRLFVRALLIKHSNTIIWNEDTLEKLYSMYLAPFGDDCNIKDTWLLDDATALITTSNWNDMNFETKITISKGTREGDSIEPLWVSSSICD
jgi:hypothetical protein